jgi:2-amino-4-hydroxy-6-hydroxymethyldihydropteridine diphosphokinase
LLGISQLYESAPWGHTDQRAFLNQAVIVDTALDPHGILREIAVIEQIAGRQRDTQWGPRTLDIDILFYDDLILNTADLNIPHPHFTERKFAMVPLCEIAPELIHPVFHQEIRELLEDSQDQSEVSILAH